MMLRAKSLSIVLVLTITCSASLAAAGDDDLSEEHVEDIEEDADEDDAHDIQRAQESFDRGASLYYEGSYGDAIVEFQRALRAYPHPIFAYNIARANVSLEQFDRALDAAREAEELIEETGEALPEDDHASNQAIIESLETRQISQSIADELEVDEELDDIDEPEAVSSWGLMGWSGVAMATVGAGALTGAAVMDRQIASDIDALESDDSISQEAFDDEVDSLEGQQTAGRVFLFAGAGMFALGSTLMILELVSSPDQEGLGMAPSLDRPGMEMTFRW